MSDKPNPPAPKPAPVVIREGNNLPGQPSTPVQIRPAQSGPKKK